MAENTGLTELITLLHTQEVTGSNPVAPTITLLSSAGA